MCSSKEKKYAHYVGQASWAGARIIQGQWTPQAEKLYDLLILTFSENGKLADLDALRAKSSVSAEEWDDLLQYTSQVRLCRHYMRLGYAWQEREGIVTECGSVFARF